MKVTLIGRPNPEVCAIAAGMCYNAKDPWKALKNAMAGGHESVLEHCKFSFQIEGVSRALLAQLTRHRIASFSVQSQRYVSYKDGFDYVTPPSILALGAEAEKRYHAQMELMHMWYCEWLNCLGENMQEDARFVLPNACCTRLVMSMNIRELRHFFSLRCCNRAQWEIRELADEMLRICKEEVYSLFEDAGAGCMRGACPEGKHSCGKPRNKEQVNV